MAFSSAPKGSWLTRCGVVPWCGARFVGGFFFFFFGSVRPSAFPWIFPSPLALGFRSRCRPFPCRHAVLGGQARAMSALPIFVIAPRNAVPHFHSNPPGRHEPDRKKSADRPWRGSREEDDGFNRGRARRYGGRFRVSGVHRHRWLLFRQPRAIGDVKAGEPMIHRSD